MALHSKRYSFKRITVLLPAVRRQSLPPAPLVSPSYSQLSAVRAEGRANKRNFATCTSDSRVRISTGVSGGIKRPEATGYWWCSEEQHGWFGVEVVVVGAAASRVACLSASTPLPRFSGVVWLAAGWQTRLRLASIHLPPSSVLSFPSQAVVQFR